MTRTIKGNFWCCGCLERPLEILYHSPVTGRALIMAGSMLYGASAPILATTKAAAQAYADEWNDEFDDPSLRVAPMRIRIEIDLDDGKKPKRKGSAK